MKRVSALLASVLVGAAFLPAYLPAVEVSADSVPIQLTASQTLALYGTSIPAKWFNGSTTQFVEFEYWKSTKDIVASYNESFPNGLSYDSGISYVENLFGVKYQSTAPYWNNQIKSTNELDLVPRWFASKSVSRSEVCPYNFLVYRCRISPDKMNNTHEYQLNFNLSLTLPNVERFRSMYAFSTARMGSPSSHDTGSQSNYSSELRLYVNNDLVNPFYVTSNWYMSVSGSPFSCAHHPLTNAFQGTEVPSTLASYQNCAYPCPNFALHAIDTDNLLTPVNISSFYFNIRGAQACVLYKDGSERNEVTDPYTYVMIMCPVVWGDITPPQPEQTTPNYSSQLDDINGGVQSIDINLDGTNDRLDTIIHKLDLIYEKMCEDENGGVDIIPPDEIGLSATAKQRALQGMQSLDSQLDSVQPSDLPSSSFSGFSSVWADIKRVMPGGLWSVYMLALLGGIISWIIYGKRGG